MAPSKSLFFLFGSIVLLIACRTVTTTRSSIDSVSVVQQYAITHPRQVFLSPTSIQKMKGLEMPVPVAGTQLDSMRMLYAAKYQFPIPNWKNPAMGYSTGFMMDTSDYPLLLAQGNNIKTIGFHFGIRNYDSVLNFGATPIFTMMIIPVGNNLQPSAKFKIAAQAVPADGGGGGGGDGYDFVQPCPGSPGCPTN